MRRRPNAFTLIELLSAMTAATVLMLTLASSIVIASKVVDAAGENSHDHQVRLLTARLQSDLRYANEFSVTGPAGARLQTLDGQGVSRLIEYQGNTEGVYRNVGGRTQRLAAGIVSAANYVDSTPAVESQSVRTRPRIRDVSSAQSDGSIASALTIDVPAGAQEGDLLLLVCGFKNTFDVYPYSTVWVRSHYTAGTSIGLSVDSRRMESTTPSRLTVGYLPYGDVAAVMIAIEDARVGWPFGWAGADYGEANISNSASMPAVIENTGTISEETLNLNLFAVQGYQFYRGTTQLPGFTEAVIETGSPWTYGACTLAATFRTGPLDETPWPFRVPLGDSTDWVSLGIEVNGANW
ncbi:type II secretion system protein J [Rhodopirellula sp. MGV]|uniref:PulJ/GspJ family protein n=1 Tax=Rhodopirellula sp. MGV TaxID=2023130 RepID=UPI000B970383|nr:hypothetical protein [Rhodopirellula sp. MGV]OYP37278.1 hypothetical protein CGZ80_05780 [Rhodopirellula sp. MGV]PNY38049.1 hypothetical protein C2E31_04650 [Rhodopirellula baltica]